jgi:hypothetical protein
MRRSAVVALVFLGVCLLAPLDTVYADVGPKPTLKIRIERDGQPLVAAGVQARLLTCEESGGEIRQRDDPLPLLDQLDLQDPSGCVWHEPPFFIYGGAVTDGACTFSGGIPDRWRLAVYVPGEERIYLTDVSERSAMHEEYVVELLADGTGQLRAGGLPIIGHNWSLTGAAVAMVLTLIIELAIVALYARWRQTPPRRLLLVALIANLVSLPGVWALAGLGYLLGGIQGGLIALALGEAAAWLAEGVAYLAAGKLKVGQSMLLSLVANLASLIVGLLIH